MKHLLKVSFLAFLTAMVSRSLPAQTSWHHSFTIGDGPAPPFESGVFFPLRNAIFGDHESGYALRGFSSRPNPGDPGNPGQIQFLSRFSHSGNNIWNVALEPEGAARDLDLVPLISTPDLFFAAYHEEPTATTKAFRIGLFQGADNAAVFAKRFETSITQPHAIEFFDDFRMGATIDRGRTLDTIVFDQSGSTTFHKRYSSPAFTASTNFNTQSFVRDFFPGRNAYLTSVSNQSDFPGQVTVTSFFTDPAGEVISGSSFQFDAQMVEAIPFPSSLEDGGMLYRFSGIFNGITVGGTPVPLTHLIKINSDGSLAWARTLYSSLLTNFCATPDALYLSGARRSPNASGPGQTDALIIQLDPATGALLKQATFASIADVDLVQGMIADSDHVFITLKSQPVSSGPDNPLRNTISTLVKMDLNLENPMGKQYLGGGPISLLPAEDASQKITRFIFSSAQDVDREIRAITLDGNFEPLSNCQLFTSVTPVLGTTSVSLTNLAVTVGPASVVASDLGGTTPDTSLALASHPLITTDICSPGGGLKIKPTENGASLILTFPAAAGITYRLFFSADLASPFTEVDSLTSSGEPGVFTRPRGNGRGFYRLSPPPPGG